MFKLALFTLVSATSITQGATSAFHTANIGAMQTMGVYAAASKVFDSAFDGNSFNTANANLYAAGEQMKGWSSYAQAQYAKN